MYKKKTKIRDCLEIKSLQSEPNGFGSHKHVDDENHASVSTAVHLGWTFKALDQRMCVQQLILFSIL